jgi:hypothetical protein
VPAPGCDDLDGTDKGDAGSEEHGNGHKDKDKDHADEGDGQGNGHESDREGKTRRLVAVRG